MKDLIFITAYCPTEEQERVLEKCVDSVLKCEKHVALISHSHVPIHIQKNVTIMFMITTMKYPMIIICWVIIVLDSMTN